MKRLYIVIVLMVICLVSALATGFDLLYRILYLLVLILVGSYVWTWFSLRKLEVTVDRHGPGAEVGGLVEERISVQNNGGLPKTLLEIEDLTDLPGHATGRAISVPPNGYHSWKVSTLCRKRGVYTLGPLRVRGIDPFGIFRQEKEYLRVQTVVVYPRALNLPKFTIPAAELSGDASQRQRFSFTTPHASSVREYEYADNMNRIHWPSTARLGKLMVKEFDPGQSSNIWIFVDLDRYVQAGEDEESTDEYAVSIAASVAKKYLEGGYPVGLVAYGDKKYLLPAETGPGQMDRIMELLAISKSEGEVPLEEALPKEESLFSRYGSLVLITPSIQQEWIPALSILIKRQVRVLAILIDPSTFGSSQSSLHILENLAANSIPAYLVNRGDDIPTALSHAYRSSETSERVQMSRGAQL